MVRLVADRLAYLSGRRQAWLDARRLAASEGKPKLGVAPDRCARAQAGTEALRSDTRRLSDHRSRRSDAAESQRHCLRHSGCNGDHRPAGSRALQTGPLRPLEMPRRKIEAGGAPNRSQITWAALAIAQPSTDGLGMIATPDFPGWTRSGQRACETPRATWDRGAGLEIGLCQLSYLGSCSSSSSVMST